MDYIHFFFHFSKERQPNHKMTFQVLTISRLSPYRLTEEQYAISCIGKYFSRDVWTSTKPVHQFKTWKLWGTNFIKELDSGRALSGYRKKRDRNIFQYLVITVDEWIEFIAYKPKWKIHKSTCIEKVMTYYLQAK